jgi:hypothetical protein
LCQATFRGGSICVQRAESSPRKAIFRLDHTKFERQSVLPLCGVDCIDTIVTSDKAPNDMAEQLHGKEIEVIVSRRWWKKQLSSGPNQHGFKSLQEAG